MGLDCGPNMRVHTNFLRWVFSVQKLEQKAADGFILLAPQQQSSPIVLLD
jgi:CHASE2 domain-containing sensor protein